ncbi:MAG: hypothetical protein HY675_17245 [Chloroflexi bacterium]|nr:hypothetical protein [Chloroflexota bacterium]
MFGYYVPYDPTSWASLEAQADKIDYVAAQWVWIDACGNLSSQDDLTLLRFARAKGIRVLPSLLTDSGWMNHRLLTDEPTTARAIQNLVDYVVDVGYDGLDLDLEGVNATDRAVYTAFVARLSAALHKKGKLLTAALPAKASDVTTGWAGAFEYAALAPHLDLAVIMTYAYTTSSTPPGSTAPHDWVDRVISYVTTQMPPQKVLPGIAFYGYDWNVTTGGKARALRYPQAAALSDKYGVPITLDTTSRSATFTYTARAGDVPPPDPKLPALDHEIKTRSRPPCPVATATPSPAPTPRPSPTPPPVQQHVVWLEDAKSVLQRVNLAEKHRTGGIATWRLGQEDSGVWAVIREYRQGR